MRLEFQIRNDIGFLRLKGRFVTGSDAELVSAKNQLQLAGISNAIADLTEVPYIDSTGLAFVVEIHKALQCRGGQLVLAGANPRVREILGLTRISQIVSIFDDQEAAEQALRSPEVLAGGAGS